MNTYGKVNDRGYLVYTMACATEQPHLVLLDDIPPAPQPGLFFHVERRQWEDLTSAEEKQAAQLASLRQLRNQLLKESDWTDTTSAPARLGQELYDQWQTYRQALRNVTDQPDPFNIVWPTPPTA